MQRRETAWHLQEKEVSFPLGLHDRGWGLVVAKRGDYDKR